MYLHSQRLLKAVQLWNTVQNTANSTYSAYKELQCSQNFCKRYVMQVNLRACSNFKTRALMVKVAHIWSYFSMAVIHERNLHSWVTRLLSSCEEFHRNSSSEDFFHIPLANYFYWRLGIWIALNKLLKYFNGSFESQSSVS